MVKMSVLPNFIYRLNSIPKCQNPRRSFCEHQQSDAKVHGRTSLVVWRIRSRLLVQGTQVQPLLLEDPTCSRAMKPCTTITEPHLQGSGSQATTTEPVQQLLTPAHLELVLLKRSHGNEEPARREGEQSLLTMMRESLAAKIFYKRQNHKLEIKFMGVPWGPSHQDPRPWLQSLVRELRSCKSHGTANKQANKQVTKADTERGEIQSSQHNIHAEQSQRTGITQTQDILKNLQYSRLCYW